MEFQKFPAGSVVPHVRSISGATSGIQGVPTRLIIPRIGLDTQIESVGVASDGAMDMPKRVEHVAWFQLGTHPGVSGSAVLDGHFWLKGGAFNDLHLLKPGDAVEISDQSGSGVVFIVRELHIYERHADTSGVFLSNDGLSHLNLVTCQGTWSSEEGTYSHRLVVFTDRKLPNGQ